MNLKLITEKFKDVLSANDLEEVHSEISKVISEQVETRLQVEKEELEKLADEYADEKTKKAVKKAKKKMEEEFKAKLESLEESIVNKLDRFLDNEISSKINEEVFAKVAFNETYAPIVEGIKNLYENRYVKLDTKGHGLVKSLKEKLNEKTKQVDSLVTEKMELASILEKTTIQGIIAEKSKSLTESQSKKLVKMCEGKDFEEIHNKIDTFVDIITESTSVASKKILRESAKTVTTTVSDEELITESKKVSLRDYDNYSDDILGNAKRLI